MSSYSKLAEKIHNSGNDFLDLLKEERLLKEAILATIVFTTLIFIFI